MLPKGIDNLFATGMMVTSNHHAHMSTRNTVSCMAQGQAAGTAAALCAMNRETTRGLPLPCLAPKAGGKRRLPHGHTGGNLEVKNADLPNKRGVFAH